MCKVDQMPINEEPGCGGRADKKVVLRSMVSELRRDFEQYYEGQNTSKSFTPPCRNTPDASLPPSRPQSRSLTPRKGMPSTLGPSRGQVAADAIAKSFSRR